MKNIFFHLFLTLSLFACKNDDDNGCIGVDCLPPETQTGKYLWLFSQWRTL